MKTLNKAGLEEIVMAIVDAPDAEKKKHKFTCMQCLHLKALPFKYPCTKCHCGEFQNSRFKFMNDKQREKREKEWAKIEANVKESATKKENAKKEKANRKQKEKKNTKKQ